jgi:hypothetical protein
MKEPTIEEIKRAFSWANEEQLIKILAEKLYLNVDYGYDPSECETCGS